MKSTRILALALATCLGGLAFAAAQDEKPKAGAALAAASSAPSEAEEIARQKPSYPLEACAVSGEKLGSMGEPVDLLVDGRLVRLCCDGCKKGVEAKKAEILARIDAAVIAEQKPLWPASMTTCPVSGEAFEEGETVDFVHGTRYVKLCCNGCKMGVAKNADALFKKIDQAMMEEQRKSYPLPTCVVSGVNFDAASAKDIFYGVTLVRLCCPKCEAGFQKNPAAFVAKVKDARRAQAKAGTISGAK